MIFYIKEFSSMIDWVLMILFFHLLNLCTGIKLKISIDIGLKYYLIFLKPTKKKKSFPLPYLLLQIFMMLTFWSLSENIICQISRGSQKKCGEILCSKKIEMTKRIQLYLIIPSTIFLETLRYFVKYHINCNKKITSFLRIWLFSHIWIFDYL